MNTKQLFASDYDEREFIGRQALRDLQRDYPEKFKYELFDNPEQYGAYDAYYFALDHTTQSIKKRIWIEIKIRDKVFPDYILENKKIRGLESERKKLSLNKDEVVFLYLNFTPNGAYLWNITDVDHLESEKREMNKATSTSRTDKTDKDVKMLDPDDAYFFDYRLNKNLILKRFEDQILLKRTKDTIKKVGLEAVLL